MRGKSLKKTISSFVLGLAVTCSALQAQAQTSDFQYRTIDTNNGQQKIWAPTQGLRWHIQYTGDMADLSQYQVINLDLFETDKEFIKELTDLGKKVICYVNAGTFESWRPDADRYDEDVIGRRNSQWRNERWIDTRELDHLRPIMRDRFIMAKEKGCHAIDADNVDGHINRTGFNLEWGDTLAFAQMIIELAHENGMAIGLKNNLTQISTLKHDIDFAVNEECFEYEECYWYEEFLDLGKPVYSVEYRLDPWEYCHEANKMGIDSILKNLELDEWMTSCQDIPTEDDEKKK